MEEKKGLFTFVDHTAEFDPTDAAENRAMGILSYLSWLVIIAIVKGKKRNSGYALFHANQGLVLAILETGLSILNSILSRIPYIGWLFSVIFYAATVFVGVLAIICFVFAIKGEAREVPFFGGIKILK